MTREGISTVVPRCPVLCHEEKRFQDNETQNGHVQDYSRVYVITVEDIRMIRQDGSPGS